MHLRATLLKLATGPLISSLIALVMVLAITGYSSGWGRVYGAECAEGIRGSSGSGDNSSSDNGSSGNNNMAVFGPGALLAGSAAASSNGNSSSDNGSSDNGGGSSISDLPSCDPLESIVGVQPRASDTSTVELGGGNPTLLSVDQVELFQWTGGGDVLVTDDPVDPAQSPGPAMPLGLRQIRASNIFMQVINPPNNINLTMRYTDADVAGLSEGGLRLFLYDAVAGTWREAPATVDPVANTVTWTNVDISQFASRFTRIAIFI